MRTLIWLAVLFAFVLATGCTDDGSTTTGGDISENDTLQADLGVDSNPDDTAADSNGSSDLPQDLADQDLPVPDVPEQDIADHDLTDVDTAADVTNQDAAADVVVPDPDTPSVTIRWSRVLTLDENPGGLVPGDYYYNPSHYEVGWNLVSHVNTELDPYPNVIDLSQTASAGALRWTVSGLNEGDVVYARARAVDSEGTRGPWSDEVSALAALPEPFLEPSEWIVLPTDASAYPFNIDAGNRGYRFAADMVGANALSGSVFTMDSNIDNVVIDINGNDITFAESAAGMFVDFSYKQADGWTIYDSGEPRGEVRNGAYKPASGERIAFVYANGPIGDALHLHHLDVAIRGVEPAAGVGWIINLNNGLVPRPAIGPQIHHNRFAIGGGESMGLIQAEARHSGTDLIGRVFDNELLIEGVTADNGGRFRPAGLHVGGGETGVIHGVDVDPSTGEVTIEASRAVIYDMASSDGDAARRHRITSITCSAGTLSVSTELAHGFATGDPVIIEGVEPLQLGGVHNIVVTDAHGFTADLFTCPADTGSASPSSEMTCHRRGASLSLRAGERVAPERVRGIPELNHRFYEVASVGDYHFTLLGIDGRGFSGIYKEGGRYVVRGEWEVFGNHLEVDADSEEVQGIANGLAGYTHDNRVVCWGRHSRMLQADGPSWTATLHNDVTIDNPLEIGTGFRLRYAATLTSLGFNTITARGPEQSAVSLGSSQSGPQPEWRPQHFFEYHNTLRGETAVFFGYGAFDDSHSWNSSYTLESPSGASQAALLLGGTETGGDRFADMDRHYHRNHFHRVTIEAASPGQEVTIRGDGSTASTTDLRFVGCSAADGRFSSHNDSVDPIVLDVDDTSWPPASKPGAPLATASSGAAY